MNFNLVLNEMKKAVLFLFIEVLRAWVSLKAQPTCNSSST
jgi:hypothetical protein